MKTNRWWQSVVLFIVSSMLIPTSNGRGETPAPAKQYLVHLTLKQGQRSGCVKAGTQKVEADPRIVVTENREADIKLGGEVAIGKMLVFYGTQVTFVLTPAAKGQIHLEGTLSVSSLANENATSAVKSETSAHFSLPVALNKSVMLSLWKDSGNERWLEVQVVRISSPHTVKKPPASSTGQAPR